MKTSSEPIHVISRARCLLGLLGGVLLTLSSVAHSVAGWPAQRDVLTAARIPPEWIFNLSAGWHFGGALMLACGIITLFTFVQAWRGRAASLWPVAIFGAAFLAFGVWAWIAGGSAGFAVFVTLGLLLTVAAWPVRGKAAE